MPKLPNAFETTTFETKIVETEKPTEDMMEHKGLWEDVNSEVEIII